MSSKKVVVAMSGGIDSSVAAALLKDMGFEVIGITMRLSDAGSSAIEDARRVALSLGLRHVTVDFRDIFQKHIIDYFCREYQRGRTPNPCVRCNEHIKFGALLKQAEELGGECLATGHYARIEKDGGGAAYLLKPGLDSRKDQSYFLYTLQQEQLQKIIMPLGGLTKEMVRHIAQEKALPVALDRESQDICFIPGSNYARFLQARIPECAMPGPIKSTEGKIIGEHRGLAFYTIGQRRGIGIAAGEPLYVVALDTHNNALIAGEKKYLYGKELKACDAAFVSGKPIQESLAVSAKIRYLHKPAPAVVSPIEAGTVSVNFNTPQLSITPGQSVVFYLPDGSQVLGGGRII